MTPDMLCGAELHILHSDFFLYSKGCTSLQQMLSIYYGAYKLFVLTDPNTSQSGQLHTVQNSNALNILW